MEQLSFTSQVLGSATVEKLKRGEVTQTLRGRLCSVVQAALRGSLTEGDCLEIALDGSVIGEAEYLSMDQVWMSELTETDATQGGFGSLVELKKALRVAGFRFFASYRLYRIRFSLKEG